MEGASAGIMVDEKIQARKESKHKTPVSSSVHLNRISPQCFCQPGYLHKSDILELVA